MRFGAMAVAAAALSIGSAAHAGVIFENDPNYQGAFTLLDRDLAPSLDGYVAQRFPVAQLSTLTGVQFTVYNWDNLLTGLTVNWKLLDASGPGNSPGVLIASQVAAGGAVTAAGVCPDASNDDCTFDNYSFSIPATTINSGLYYMELQFYDGGNADNAIEMSSGTPNLLYTLNGGSTYQVVDTTGFPDADKGWAMTIYGTAGYGTGGVPEPATWALMIMGFGLAGTTLRRRRALV